MFDFSDHDRAVEALPEQRQLDAALSRQSKAQRERDTAHEQLREAKLPMPSYRGETQHARRLRSDALDQAQRVFDEREDELQAAKAGVKRLKATKLNLRLKGNRVDTHRQIVVEILNAMRRVRTGIRLEREFRRQLGKDQIVFSRPLESMVSVHPAAIEALMPVVEDWIAKIERADAYRITS